MHYFNFGTYTCFIKRLEFLSLNVTTRFLLILLFIISLNIEVQANSNYEDKLILYVDSNFNEDYLINKPNLVVFGSLPNSKTISFLLKIKQPFIVDITTVNKLPYFPILEYQNNLYSLRNAYGGEVRVHNKVQNSISSLIDNSLINEYTQILHKNKQALLEKIKTNTCTACLKNNK